MATNNTYSVPYRRKREGKTDYRKRLKMLTGSAPRLVVRKSLRYVVLQVIEFSPSGDKVIVTAHSKELAKFGWKADGANTSAAYLTGLLIAKKLKKKMRVLVDLGQNVSVKGSVLYAAVKGAQDGGLDVPCAKEVLPSDDRVRGEHVAKFAKALKAQKDRYQVQFAKYIKSGVEPEQLPALVDQVKSKIGGAV
ncbi:50S ribosomal protein L18 [Candidatus Woesearchaeota archaeon]|nr:MAG: 50S ribosomal protein L18 [Candidatus Woesearchaeota archaeon]